MPRRSLRFAELTIEHDERVLEPRPWTELQSRWAAELLADAPRGPVLELCCGAGHIGLAAAALSGREVVCVDASDAACYFTRLNAEAAGLAPRVDVRHARLESAVGPDERFALVVADPPWVPDAQVDAFPDDPHLAIAGGSDGLDVARLAVDVSARHLVAGGTLLLQLGTSEQADAVATYAVGSDWREGARRHGPPGRGLVQQLVRTGDDGSAQAGDDARASA